MTLSEALNAFRWQHGDESRWTPQEWLWHDLLVETVKRDEREQSVEEVRSRSEKE